MCERHNRRILGILFIPIMLTALVIKSFVDLPISLSLSNDPKYSREYADLIRYQEIDDISDIYNVDVVTDSFDNITFSITKPINYNKKLGVILHARTGSYDGNRLYNRFYKELASKTKKAVVNINKPSSSFINGSLAYLDVISHLIVNHDKYDVNMSSIKIIGDGKAAIITLMLKVGLDYTYPSLRVDKMTLICPALEEYIANDMENALEEFMNVTHTTYNKTHVYDNSLPYDDTRPLWPSFFVITAENDFDKVSDDMIILGLEQESFSFTLIDYKGVMYNFPFYNAAHIRNHLSTIDAMRQIVKHNK